MSTAQKYSSMESMLTLASISCWSHQTKQSCNNKTTEGFYWIEKRYILFHINSICHLQKEECNISSVTLSITVLPSTLWKIVFLFLDTLIMQSVSSKINVSCRFIVKNNIKGCHPEFWVSKVSTNRFFEFNRFILTIFIALTLTQLWGSDPYLKEGTWIWTHLDIPVFEMRYMFTCGPIGSFLFPRMGICLDTTLLNKPAALHFFKSLSWISAIELTGVQKILQNTLVYWRNEMFRYMFKYIYTLQDETEMREKNKKFVLRILFFFFFYFLRRLFAKARSNLTTAQGVRTLFHFSWRPVCASQSRELRGFCVHCTCLFEVNFGNRGWDSSAAQTERY